MVILRCAPDFHHNKNRASRNYDQIATEYDKLGQYGGYDEFYRNTVARLGAVSGKILDVGCGYGKLLAELQRQKTTQPLDLYGIDICAPALSHCKEQGFQVQEEVNSPCCGWGRAAGCGSVEYC